MKTKSIAALSADLAQQVWREMMDEKRTKIERLEKLFGISIASRDEARQYLGEARYAVPAFAFHEEGRLHLLGVRDQPSQRAADMIANGHAWLFRKLALQEAPDLGQLELPDFARQIIIDSRISASMVEACCFVLGKIHIAFEDGRTISISQENSEDGPRWKDISIDASFSPRATYNINSVTIASVFPVAVQKSMPGRRLDAYISTPYRADNRIKAVGTNKKSTTLILENSTSS